MSDTSETKEKSKNGSQAGEGAAPSEAEKSDATKKQEQQQPPSQAAEASDKSGGGKEASAAKADGQGEDGQQQQPTPGTSMDFQNPNLLDGPTTPEAPPKEGGEEPDASGSPIEAGSSENVQTTPSEKDGKKGSKEKGGSTRKRKKGEKIDMSNVKIGILGAGKMAEAITNGLITISKIEAGRIFVGSKSGKNLDQFKQKGCKVTKRLYDLFAKQDCDVFFFCFHGFAIRSCFRGGGTRAMALTINYIPNMRHPIYFLSLVGGVPLSDIKQCLLNPDGTGALMAIPVLQSAIGLIAGMATFDSAGVSGAQEP